MKSVFTNTTIRFLIVLLLAAGLLACSGPDSNDTETPTGAADSAAETTPAGDTPTETSAIVPTDTASQDASPTTGGETPPAPTDTTSTDSPPTATLAPQPEPSPTAQVSQEGALLPNHRILSFYGHPNSSAMGILGEYSKEEVHRLLAEQAVAYEAADPTRPVILAFELIATVAQPWPGDDGTYVAYTGDEIIQEFVDYVTANDMILILDLQIGHDTIPNQINLIRHWLELPNVHVALDPEFSMKANEIVPNDRIPGEFIGEANGIHIQEGMELLSQIVAEAGIPPKMLIVHQFEEDMIFNKDQITPVPGVQFVLDMDGFGSPDAKTVNYGHFVTEELIEFGGIKLFYRQDDPLLTPEQIVALDPPALVVIYQ